MDKFPMTRGGHAALETELKKLKSVERPSVIKAIAEARELGDLKENAEYHSAREKQSFIEGRIAELEDIVSRAEAIDTSEMSGEIIRFGATVMVADADTDEETSYRIVGAMEASLEDGKISVTSPLGKALIGKTIGDVIEVATPGGGKSYEIRKVSWL